MFPILFLVLAMAVMPIALSVVMAYFVLVGMIISLAGHLIKGSKILFAGNATIAMSTIILLFGLIFHGWS